VNCDPIARWYRWLEYAGFGGELERRRYRFLPEIADARRVLILGEGDGRFLAKLVEQARKVGIEDYEFDYVDLSGRMLQLARERAGTEGVTYHQADALTIPLPRARYDLIVTHFLLDCFEQADAERLIARLADAARPESRWVVSEFREQSQGLRGFRVALRGIWAWVWLRGLYFFFRITTGLVTQRVADYHPILERYGFRLAQSEDARFGLLGSELWARKEIPAP